MRLACGGCPLPTSRTWITIGTSEPSSLRRRKPTNRRHLPATDRTRQTADALGLKYETRLTLSPNSSASAVLREAHWPDGDRNVLVVGHSNSVPDIVKALGGTAAITIADDEFDNLFIVRPGPPASVIRLHMPPVR